jgi:hypothetical protein
LFWRHLKQSPSAPLFFLGGGYYRGKGKGREEKEKKRVNKSATGVYKFHKHLMYTPRSLRTSLKRA